MVGGRRRLPVDAVAELAELAVSLFDQVGRDGEYRHAPRGVAARGAAAKAGGEAGHQRLVAARVEARKHALAGGVALRGQKRLDVVEGARLRFVEAGTPLGHAFELDIEVTDVAEEASDPADLVAVGVHARAEEGLESAEGGAHAAGGDAHVVECFDVLAEPRPCFVGEEGAELLAQDREAGLAGRHRGAQFGQPEVGFGGRDLLAGGEKTGFELGRAGGRERGRSDEDVDEALRAAGRAGLHLDLDARQTGGNVFADGNGGVVDGDLGHRAGSVGELEDAALGPDVEDRAKLLAANDGAQGLAAGACGECGAIDRLIVELFRDLATATHGVHGFGHRLERELGAVALAAHAAGEAGVVHAPVGGVEVGVVEVFRGPRRYRVAGDGGTFEPARDGARIERGELPFDFGDVRSFDLHSPSMILVIAGSRDSRRGGWSPRIAATLRR